MIDCNNNIMDFDKIFDEFCHSKCTCAYCYFFVNDFNKCKVKDFGEIDITDINLLQKWKESQDNEVVD